MPTLADEELDLLKRYAENKSLMIETGRGASTKHLAKVAKKNGSAFYSIDIYDTEERIDGASLLIGWSIAYSDFIKKDDPDFVESPYKKCPETPIIYEGKRHMIGPTNLIRKILRAESRYPDFFFCDTGEYCGLPEWRIVKDHMRLGSIFAIHDIYYPKSIKGFKVVREMNDDPNWALIGQTRGEKGLAIAQRVKANSGD